MHRLFYGIFFLSGLTGLIYESVWTRYLKQILGHAAYAQTVVLVIFMGGMAIGAWLAGRRSAGLTQPLKAYAVVEGGIGVLGIAFHGIFLLVASLLFDALLPALGSPWLANAVKWLVAGLLILPQSILLGTTFPLMSVGLIRLRPGDSGRALGMLYFTNSIGAVAGVLLAALWLVPALGLPGTIGLAGLLNLLLALVAWQVAAKADLRGAPMASSGGRLPASRLFIWAAFVTGMASFFYEIGWIRMLSLVLGSTVQAFELMLAAFIAGLAFGGLWIRKRLDRIERLETFAGIVQLLMGTLALLTLPAYGLTYDAMAWLLSAVAPSDGGYLLFNAASMGLAMFIMVPTTFMAGMTLPLFTQAAMKAGAGEGGVGRVYAANTIGAIAGVILAVHLLMSLVGTRGVIIAGAAVDLALGLLLLYRGASSRRHAHALTATCAVILCVAIAGFDMDARKTASGVYRHGVPELSASLDLLFYKDGQTATVAVVRDEDGAMSIKTNGKPDARLSSPDQPAGADELTMILLAAMPLAVAPDAQHVANIGMGSGLTTHVLLADPAIETVETIEIEAAMVEGARLFGDQVARAWSDPRSVIRINDAKSYFSAYGKQYDIIVSEPSNPWVSGVASLFSSEFYAQIKRHLTDDGVLVQWLQLYETDFLNFASVLKALSQEFPAYDIYSTNDGDVLVIARQARNADPLVAAIFDQPAMRAHLERIHVESVADLQARWVGSERQYDLLLQSIDAPVNSDFHPFLEYAAPRTRFLRERVQFFEGMREVPVPVLEMLSPVAWSPGDISHGVQPHFAYSGNVAVAREMAAYVLEGRRPKGPDAQWQMVLHIAQDAARGCRTDVSSDLLIEAHYRLAALANAFLDPETAAAFWNEIAPHACTTRWPGAVGRWLALHRAVAARDAATMLQASQAILDSEATLERWQEYYLQLAMLTAAVVSNDDAGEAVARYWLRRNGSAIDADLLLRMLALQALDSATRD